MAEHVPMSISICSNVPDFLEAKCFVSEGDPQVLVDSTISYLEEMVDHAYRLLREDRFAGVYEQLDDLELREEDGAEPRGQYPATELRALLDAYLQELPVVGFNSGSYDLNVMKPYFFHHFLHREDAREKTASPFTFVVKKNNKYICVASAKLKFLDIINYLAPGYSYSKYLAAFDVEEKKGFFPYEFVRSLEQLNTVTSLPTQAAFESTLKNENIDEKDYAYCTRVWRDNGMKSLKDFLIWYNNKDVVPFLLGLEKQTLFYATLGVDMLKDAISVPGLTLKYLMTTLPPGVFLLIMKKLLIM
ncbi:hypothetical protein ACOMHN_066078 [Nucella lapillus]